MDVLIKEIRAGSALGLCKAGGRSSSTDTGQVLLFLSMGHKCADHVSCRDWESGGSGSSKVKEVYLPVGYIGFLQKQTGVILFAACFSSCDLLYD